MDILLGTAVLVAPRGNLALLAGVGAIKGTGAIVKRIRDGKRRKRNADSSVLVPVEENGGIKPALLTWRDVKCELATKSGEMKVLLKGLSGAAKPGRLLAIMGPSGSGKTTLLNTLAGQLPKNKHMTLQGAIEVNGAPVSDGAHSQAFVEQDNKLYSMLTTNETLDFAARLQLPEGLSEAERTAYVNKLVSVLGLAKAKDTIVGDAKARGLSGGEVKRLALGCELIGSPSLVFLDEPTTGLDSFQAEKVMSTVKELATAGRTVVCSIHQPRSSIFDMFDDLLLLSEGAEVYAGPANGVLEHFRQLGHDCPQFHNPAEFVADLISIDFTNHDTETESRARVAELVQAWQAHKKRTNGQDSAAASGSGGAMAARAEASSSGEGRRAACGPWRQFWLLLTRSWRQIIRDKAAQRARLMSNLSSALVFGAIYFRMKLRQSSIQDRMGLLQVAAVGNAMSSLVKTLYIFPVERIIVNRERAKGSYSVLPYLSAKLMAELLPSAIFPVVFGAVVYPLTGLNPRPSRILKFLGIMTLEAFTSAALGLTVGAVAPSPEAAVAIGPAVMLIWIVFGGFYCQEENIPRALRWLPSASLIRHAFVASCVNEFPGMQFELDKKGKGMATGEDVLDWLGFSANTVRGSMLREARILLVYYWLTLNILRAGGPRYQQLQAPAVQEEPQDGQAAAAQPVAA